MSRSTQYVGLTNDAMKWIEKERAAGNVLEEKSIIIDNGMFDEPVHGTEWKLRFQYPDVNEYLLVREKTQACPWSSGPMFFTCLEVFLKKKAQPNPIEMGHYFEWVVNPDVQGEYDSERGHYYV